MIATLDPNQFQAVVLAFIAALVVIIPSASAVVIKAITSWQEIIAAWHRETAAKVQEHDTALNGALDQRIDDRARAVVEAHADASGNVGGAPASAPAPHGSSLQGPAATGDSSLIGK